MKRVLIAAPVLLALVAGCATHNPDVIHPYEAQRMSTVLDATVLSVRPVTIDGRQGGVGGTAGAVVGGVAGSSLGHNYHDATVGAVLGAVAGAVVGNAIERGANTEQGVEIVVQLRNGERRAIVQAQGQQMFQPGDPVMLVTSGGRTRLERAPAVYMPPPPQPNS